MFSDNCRGQNKNNNVSNYKHSHMLLDIEHIFLTLDNTYMACSHAFNHTEKAIRVNGDVHDGDDYCVIV